MYLIYLLSSIWMVYFFDFHYYFTVWEYHICIWCILIKPTPHSLSFNSSKVSHHFLLLWTSHIPFLKTHWAYLMMFLYVWCIHLPSRLTETTPLTKLTVSPTAISCHKPLSWDGTLSAFFPSMLWFWNMLLKRKLLRKQMEFLL